MTLYLWRHEVNEKRRDEERRASSAVTAWRIAEPKLIEGTGVVRPHVAVQNSSPDLITTWSVDVCLKPPCDAVGHEHGTTTWGAAREHGPLTPGRYLEIPHREPLPGDELSGHNYENGRIAISYVDSAGRLWFREGDHVERRR